MRGYNGDGELGNGTMTNSSAPVAVQGISGATSVNTGYKHACALSGASTFSCWGSNELGELGIGTLTNSSTPVAVNELNGVVANSSGAAHTCAVLTDGALYCWGDNEFGELGIGTLNRLAPYGISSPEQVNTVSNAIGVSAGFLHTCALISGGSIECWGYTKTVRSETARSTGCGRTQNRLPSTSSESLRLSRSAPATSTPAL